MAIIPKARKDGGTSYLVRVHAGSGRQVSKTFRTKREAEKWERSQKVAIDKGARPAGTAEKSVKLADYAERWYESRLPTWAPTTAERVRAQVGVWIVGGPIADVPIGSLRPDHLRTLYTAMRDAGLADSTQAGVDKTLRLVVGRAVRDEVLAADPYPKLERGERPAGKRRTMRLLTPDEIRFVENTIEHLDPGGPSRLMVRLAAQTGMRSEEVIGLRAQYLDVKARELVVAEVAPQVGGHAVPSEVPKTDAAYRTIALPDALAAELGEYNTAIGRGFVFTWHDGRPVRRNSWWRGYWRPAVRELDKPWPRYHDLRHSHASQLLRSGVPVTAVSQRLGHANPAVTLKLYSHTMPGMDREAADAIGAIYG